MKRTRDLPVLDSLRTSELPVLDCPSCDQPDTYEAVIMIHPGDRVYMRCRSCGVAQYMSVDDVFSARADTEATAAERGIITE